MAAADAVSEFEPKARTLRDFQVFCERLESALDKPVMDDRSKRRLDRIKATRNAVVTTTTKTRSITTQNVINKQCGLFYGTLGLWKGSSYKIELQDDAKPHHACLYSIPHAYEQTFKQEVKHLCKVGVLRKINRSEWAAPTFLIPKKDCLV